MQEIKKRVEGKDGQGVLISRAIDGIIYGSDGNVAEEYHKEATVIDSTGKVLEEAVRGIKYAGNQSYQSTIKYDTSGKALTQNQTTGADQGSGELIQKVAAESQLSKQAADKRFSSEMKITQKSSAAQQK
jgi:hypothetical protein